MPLLLLILLFGMAAAAQRSSDDWSPADIIPARMLGTHLDEEIHVARVRFGTPSRELRLALDFGGRRLIVSSAPSQSTGGDTGSSDPADWSSTYSVGGGGSDLVRIGGRRYRVPVSFDQYAALLFGCPSCHGILGVGPASPLWLVWPRATFSAGAVTLGRRLPPVGDPGRARIACDLMDPDTLCTAVGQAFGTNYTIRFEFRSIYTVVPQTVYDQYVGARSVSTTPVRDWPSLRLRFIAADAPTDPRRPTLQIAPSSLVGDSRHGGARTLLLRPAADPASSEIVLGRTAWRSIMMYREFDRGLAVIQTIDSTKRFPTWALVAAVVTAIAMARWWMTRDAMFYESVTGSGPKRAESNKVVGDPFMSSGDRRHPSYPGEWGVYPDRLLIELAAVPGAVATLYIPPLRDSIDDVVEMWALMQALTYLCVVWVAIVWVARLAGRADMFGVIQRWPMPGVSFIIFRAGLIRQASVDLLMSVILFMLSTLTRTDTLGQTMVAVAGGILSGVILYHFVNSVIHLIRFAYTTPLGPNRGEGFWLLWMLYMGLMTLTLAVFVSVFVLVPFMQLHVTSANGGDYVLAAFVVYVFGIALAYALADHEADRMELWIARQSTGPPATMKQQ